MSQKSLRLSDFAAGGSTCERLSVSNVGEIK